MTPNEYLARILVLGEETGRGNPKAFEVAFGTAKLDEQIAWDAEHRNEDGTLKSPAGEEDEEQAIENWREDKEELPT